MLRAMPSLDPSTPASAPRTRRRETCALAVVATLLLGLASRRWPLAPGIFGKYPGDALWAAMVFFAWASGRPRARTLHLALAAGATATVVEFAKLWQAPWLVELRHTTLGHLVFGHVFSWQNLGAYALGILAGCALDPLLAHPRPHRDRAAIAPR